MRALAVIAPLLLAVLSVQASTAPPTYGAGPIAFAEHAGPDGLTASEPTIGIPWNTDHVFFNTLERRINPMDPLTSSVASKVYRVTFDDVGTPTWTDVTPPYQVPTNLDPMLVADEDTGRIWAGGLHGGCSVMMYSDDDGESWLSTGNMCSGADFDHQSLGSGPSKSPLAGKAYPHAAYYCGQGGTISCATSYDGGVSWTPFVQEQTACGGFHGHIRVSRISAMMAVPVADCGGDLGMLTTLDGVVYTAKTIPDSEEWTNGFDPSLQFGRQQGWLWYGMASENGIHISLSKDDGATWESLGGSNSLDIGQFHDPPIVAGSFANIQVGDDDRVAFTFLGIEGGPGADLEFLNSNQIYQCDKRQDELVWNYYAAFTFDAGATWNVSKLTQDPVQVGGLFDAVVDGSSNCRNLLDFNDMDIDSKGRVYIGWADGCVRECAETSKPETDGWRAKEARILRQISGKGLFAAHDVAEPTVPPQNSTAPPTDSATPLPALPLLLAALAAVAWWRRTSS